MNAKWAPSASKWTPSGLTGPFKIVLTLAFWLDFVLVHALGTLLLNSRCILESKWTPSGLQVTSKCFQKDAKRLQVPSEWPEVLAKPCSLSQSGSILPFWAPLVPLCCPNSLQVVSTWPQELLHALRVDSGTPAKPCSLSRSGSILTFLAPLVHPWNPSGLQVVHKWSPGGLKVDSKWASSGFQVHSKWSSGLTTCETGLQVNSRTNCQE